MTTDTTADAATHTRTLIYIYFYNFIKRAMQQRFSPLVFQDEFYVLDAAPGPIESPTFEKGVM